LIQKFHNFSVPIQKAKEKIADTSTRLPTEEKTKFASELKLFRSITVSILNTNGNRIKNASYAIQQQSQFIVKNNHEKLNVLQAKPISFRNLEDLRKSPTIEHAEYV
jgi:exodeoxyribonuclease VII large subunit